LDEIFIPAGHVCA